MKLAFEALPRDFIIMVIPKWCFQDVGRSKCHLFSHHQHNITVENNSHKVESWSGLCTTGPDSVIHNIRIPSPCTLATLPVYIMITWRWSRTLHESTNDSSLPWDFLDEGCIQSGDGAVQSSPSIPWTPLIGESIKEKTGADGKLVWFLTSVWRLTNSSYGIFRLFSSQWHLTGRFCLQSTDATALRSARSYSNIL